MIGDVIFRRQLRPFTRTLRAVVLPTALGFAVLIGAASEGALQHQYLFQEGAAGNAMGRTVMDSVGGQHGTVVGGSAMAIASATSNSIVLGGGGQATSAYVDLPNNMISGFTDVSFEAWYTVDTATNWSRVFDFGSRENVGEVLPETGNPAGAGGSYIMYSASRATNTNQQQAGIRANDPPTDPAGPNQVIEPNIAYTLGTMRHVALVYDSMGGEGAAPASMTVYLDGIQRGTVNTPIQLSQINDVNNWLGRSNWDGDQNLSGSISEFRIYDEALSAEDVLSSFNIGCDQCSLPPSLVINRDTGAISLASGSEGVPVIGYEISSASGGLNQTRWLSVADNYDADSGVPAERFDSDDVWTKLSATGSKTDFAEMGFGGDGGVLGIGGTTELQLGGAGQGGGDGAWIKSIYEDLSVAVRLEDGSLLPTAVRWTGNDDAPFQRSDLNFDGEIDATDWGIFLANSGTSLAGMSIAESYRLGDLNGSLSVGYQDFRLFKGDFIAANGDAAWVALAASVSVPEPSTVVLMLLFGLSALLPARIRR